MLELVALAVVLQVPTMQAPISPGHFPIACHALPSRAVAGLSGQRISQVRVLARGPDGLLADLGVPMHVVTRDETIRSRLLFAVGDTLDILRVTESVRQLRRLRYLAGADVTAACDSTGSVILTVVTRDRWSIIPRLATGGSTGMIAGVEEMNLFGTGRDGRVSLRSDRGQLGMGVAYADPTLFGGRVIGTVSHDTYSDGNASSASLRSRDDGVLEAEGFSLDLRRSDRQSIRSSVDRSPGDTVRRATASLLVRHRVSGASDGNATLLLLGAEAERAMLTAGADLPLAGPPVVRRTFAGLDVGVSRRVGLFEVIPWLVPQSDSIDARLAPAEVAIGLESEGVVSLGRDFAAGRPAGRVDLWVGRVWRVGGLAMPRTSAESPPPRALISGDVWASGYHYLGGPPSEWTAGTLRGALGLVMPSGRGLWSAQVSAERLMDPDPDVRGLQLLDRVQRALPRGARLAETAVSASLERAVPLLQARRGYVLQGAAFLAGSARWDVASPTPLELRASGVEEGDAATAASSALQRVYAGYAGLGLRLAPTRFGRPILGLDIVAPVRRSPQVSGRPYVILSVKPTFGWGRGRDATSP